MSGLCPIHNDAYTCKDAAQQTFTLSKSVPETLFLADITELDLGFMSDADLKRYRDNAWCLANHLISTKVSAELLLGRKGSIVNTDKPVDNNLLATLSRGGLDPKLVTRIADLLSSANK